MSNTIQIEKLKSVTRDQLNTLSRKQLDNLFYTMIRLPDEVKLELSDTMELIRQVASQKATTPVLGMSMISSGISIIGDSLQEFKQVGPYPFTKKYNCSHCKDNRYFKVRPKPSANNWKYKKPELKPCPVCQVPWIQSAKQKKRRTRVERFFPKRIGVIEYAEKELDLDDYNKNQRERFLSNFQYAQEFCQATHDHNQNNMVIAVSGPHGRGKTLMVSKMYRWFFIDGWNTKGKYPAYITGVEISRQFKNFNTLDERVQALIEADLVIIDEAEKSDGGDWSRRFIHYIYDMRQMANLPLAIVFNDRHKFGQELYSRFGSKNLITVDFTGLPDMRPDHERIVLSDGPIVEPVVAL